MLFFLQAYFAATKRLQLHMLVGRVGMWYAGLLILVGLNTGVLLGELRSLGVQLRALTGLRIQV